MNLECMMAASNRSLASLMALSPRPTMETEGGPIEHRFQPQQHVLQSQIR